MFKSDKENHYQTALSNFLACMIVKIIETKD